MHIRSRVAPMLARPVDRLPEGRACAGGGRYEPKWDGFRCIAIVDDDRGVQLGSRRLKRLNETFPEIVAAVFEHLPAQTATDGEIVRWSPAGRLELGALQRRNTAGRRAAELAQLEPCHYVVFDVLEAAGQGATGCFMRA
jgi:ATP-dependent DNA ligase